MPRRATVPQLLEHLRTYLNERDAEWNQEGRQAPTVPATNDGKVNIRSLMRDFQFWADERGTTVPSSAAQYVYEHKEWADEISAIAVAQGLKPVGSRRLADAEDDAALARISRLQKDVKRQSEGHAQSKARIAMLERELAEKDAEIRRLRERFSLMQKTGAILRTDGVSEE